MGKNYVESYSDYVKEMTEDQKIVFLKIMAHMASSGKDLSKEEQEEISYIAVLFNVPLARMPEIIEPASGDDLIKEAKIITSRKVALHLIKEACLLANLDGDFSENEMKFVGKLGQSLGIELEKIEQISQWVLDRLIWLEEEKIIFEND